MTATSLAGGHTVRGSRPRRGTEHQQLPALEDPGGERAAISREHCHLVSVRPVPCVTRATWDKQVTRGLRWLRDTAGCPRTAISLLTAPCPAPTVTRDKGDSTARAACPDRNTASSPILQLMALCGVGRDALEGLLFFFNPKGHFWLSPCCPGCPSRLFRAACFQQAHSVFH